MFAAFSFNVIISGCFSKEITLDVLSVCHIKSSPPSLFAWQRSENVQEDISKCYNLS